MREHLGLGHLLPDRVRSLGARAPSLVLNVIGGAALVVAVVALSAAFIFAPSARTP